MKGKRYSEGQITSTQRATALSSYSQRAKWTAKMFWDRFRDGLNIPLDKSFRGQRFALRSTAIDLQV